MAEATLRIGIDPTAARQGAAEVVRAIDQIKKRAQEAARAERQRMEESGKLDHLSAEEKKRWLDEHERYYIRHFEKKFRREQEAARKSVETLREQLLRAQREREAIFEADIASFRAAVAEGFMTPREAAQLGREAATAYNQEVLKILSRGHAAGVFEGSRGAPLAAYTAIAGSIKNVDESARRAFTGVGRLNLAFSSLASQAAGAHPAIGQLANTIGSFALGSAWMLGVMAGLGAIALAWRKITEDSRKAREESQRAIDTYAEMAKERESGGTHRLEAALTAQRRGLAELRAEAARIEAQLAQRRASIGAGPIVGLRGGERQQLERELRGLEDRLQEVRDQERLALSAISETEQQIAEVERRNQERAESEARAAAAAAKRASEELEARKRDIAAMERQQYHLARLNELHAAGAYAIELENIAHQEREELLRNEIRFQGELLEQANEITRGIADRRREAARLKEEQRQLAEAERAAAEAEAESRRKATEAQREYNEKIAEADRMSKLLRDEQERLAREQRQQMVQALDTLSRALDGTIEKLVAMVSVIAQLQEIDTDTWRGKVSLTVSSVGLGAQFGRQAGSPIIGAVGGAAAGFAMGGPVGAFLGGVSGIIGGLTEAAERTRQAARQMEEAQRQWNRAVEGFSRISSPLTNFEEQIRDLEQKLIDSWQDFLLSFPFEDTSWIRFVDTIEEVQRSMQAWGAEAQFEEFERALEAIRERQALEQEAFQAELDVRKLRLQGHEEEARALELEIRQRRELEQARRVGFSEETIATLRRVQEEERAAAAANSLADSFDRLTSAINAPSGLRLSLLRHQATDPFGIGASSPSFQPPIVAAAASAGRTQAVISGPVTISVQAARGQDARVLVEEIVRELERIARSGGVNPVVDVVAR